MKNERLTIALFLCCFLWQCPLFAQEKADALLQKISEECCVCSEENIASTDSLTSLQLETALGLCLMKSFGIHENELAAQGININDQDIINSYSEKLGENLARNCEHFLSILFQLMSDDNSNTRNEMLKNSSEGGDSPSGIIASNTGTIKKVEADMFLRIWLQHNSGEDVFICLDDIQDVAFLNDVSSMIGKTVTVRYVATQVYAPKEKKMIEMKKLISLTLAN
jgi:hypothetical protein